MYSDKISELLDTYCNNLIDKQEFVNQIELLFSNNKMVKDGFEEWLESQRVMRMEDMKYMNYSSHDVNSLFSLIKSEYLKFQPGEKSKSKLDLVEAGKKFDEILAGLTKEDYLKWLEEDEKRESIGQQKKGASHE